MKTKNIFKVLALAMLMPAMLLTTACSNQDDVVNTENTNQKGYALPVTVNVTRQGDATTRATYNESTRKLEFSTGDKLFVQGVHNEAGSLAGALTWQSGGTFTGTIYTKNEYSGTIEALLSEGELQAILLPNGYEKYGYWRIENNNTEALYDDYTESDGSKAFAFTKATAVEQFSSECAYYKSSCFALEPVNVIANFTITGLTADKEVDVLLTHPYGTRTISGKVTTDGSGNATFAVGLLKFCGTFSNISLTVDGNKIILGNHAIEAGHIYNITRSSAPATDLSMLDCAGNARASRWTANCYMVHTAGNYKLPLVYGNAIKNGETNNYAYTGVAGTNTIETFPRHDGSAITGPWIKDNGITVKSAELVWQDAEGLITAVGISGDYLMLTVGKDATTQEGNAVVAAKDASGNIVWSWHLWVTKQTFAADDLTTVDTGSNTYQLTPVNLGWVSNTASAPWGNNTFYQGGRKDPFPSTGDVTYSTSNATIADNIKNPATLYNVVYKPNTSTALNLWDAQQTSGNGNIATATVKTVYDPCPAGFCVPTDNLYYFIKNGGVSFSWDDTNKGYTLSSVTPNVFFPASGLRNINNNSNGSLEFVGSNGYCWSASATNSGIWEGYGYYLGFVSSDWYWANFGRAQGYPVRAVAEE